MDASEFERDFLKLVHETDVVITPANIAYHLKIPIQDAQEQLLALELNGVLREVVDADGISTFVMPNRARTQSVPATLDDLARSSRAYATDLVEYRESVHSPLSGRALNGLVMNLIVPGTGSLLCGKKSGAWLLGGVALGISLLLLLPGWSRIVGLVPLLGSWVVSAIQGVQLLIEDKKRSRA